MKKLLKKLIGDKKFYAMVLSVALPIMVQNGITTFVSLLDNIMVGRVGTEPMSGVSVANQILFVVNLCIFGAVSGAGIYGAQFYGKGDTDGIRYALRFKLVAGALLCLVGIALLFPFGEALIVRFLHEGSQTGDLALALKSGVEYMRIMFLGFIPFALSQAYGSTLRETGETKIPMYAGIAAVGVNLGLNYVLIFGKFGAPVLGVRGAAMATVAARFVEAAIVMAYMHHKKEKNPFAVGLYKNFRIPGALAKDIFRRTLPLTLNEGLWAAGMAMLSQSYSTRGLAVVAAQNILMTITNLFSVTYMALGSAIAIVVGKLMGANRMEEAYETDIRMIAFSVMSCFVMGGLLLAFGGYFPMIYNTTDEVRSLAAQLIRVAACFMPMQAAMHACYFTLRSGGKTFVTFLFDSGFVWVVVVPLSYVLTRFTTLSILPIYALCTGSEAIKCVLGIVLVKKKVWIRNLVGT